MKQIPRDFHQYVSHIFSVEQKLKIYEEGRVKDEKCSLILILNERVIAMLHTAARLVTHSFNSNYFAGCALLCP
jgi:hypothetical protein